MTPPAPPEPVELKAAMRAEAHADPAAARAGLAGGRRIGEWLWDAWRGPLEAAGADRVAVVRSAAALDRELWLWVMDERRWEEAAGLVYGRAARHR